MNNVGGAIMSFTLKNSLLENNSIQLNKTAEVWQDAIKIAVQPLVESNAVDGAYADAIIESTLEYGPYYILVPGVAMPHAKPGPLVLKDSFSLTVLSKPVEFPDGSDVSILLCLAATSGDAHTTVAIPQVVSLLQLEDIEEKLRSANGIDDIIQLLDEAEQMIED